MLISDLPVVFISFDEPWADDYYTDLKRKFPPAKRVQGVKGLDACHKAAAEEAGGRWFITVDADTLVRPEFFDMEIDPEFLSDTLRLDWPGRNAVNGLTYGNGSLKLWPREMVMNMMTHEAAPAEIVSLDHDVGKETGSNPGSRAIHMPVSYASTHPSETAFHAFRCGFREAFRMSRPPGSHIRGRGFETELARSNVGRLKVWCSIGAHAANGDWVIYGARLGLLKAQQSELPPGRINDFDWYQELWQDIVLPRMTGTGGACKWFGDRWDPDALVEESEGLRETILRELDFEICSFSPQRSAMVEGALRECASPSMVDTIGAMVMTGDGMEQDLDAAGRYFEIGLALDLPRSFNNLGQLTRMTDDDAIERVRLFYEEAIVRGDENATENLIRLLEDKVAPSPERDARLADALAERELAIQTVAPSRTVSA